MRSLITGGYGFVGRHLAQALVKCGDDVALTYRPSGRNVPDDDGKGVGDNKVPVPRSCQSLALDLVDKKAVGEVIALLRPDAIYHLAGQTFVPDGEKDFPKVMEINFQGTLNLLEAVKEHSPQTRFLYASSSEVYGDPVPGTLPITERSTLRPVSNYGVSKAAADLAVFKFAHRENIHAVRVRAFPHIGPGQSPDFAISSFAKQLAEIKLGKAEPILRVGNLEARRDYSDVSDIVRGYYEALQNGKIGHVYNLCAGQSYEIGELLQMLIKVAEVEVEVETDPERVRPIDIADIVGSYERATKDFGWKPRIELQGTLHSLFAYWVETLAAAK